MGSCVYIPVWHSTSMDSTATGLHCVCILWRDGVSCPVSAALHSCVAARWSSRHRRDMTSDVKVTLNHNKQTKILYMNFSFHLSKSFITYNWRNCVLGNVCRDCFALLGVDISPRINRQSRVSHPGPGFLSSATWPSLLKKHYNGLIKLYWDRVSSLLKPLL